MMVARGDAKEGQLETVFQWFEFSPAPNAEVLQVIVVGARDGLNFVRSEVRFGIALENSRYQPFPALDHRSRGVQTNSTDQCINWYECAGILERVLEGIDQQPCTLIDEGWIQPLELNDPFCDEFPPILMPLGDPGVDGWTQSADEWSCWFLSSAAPPHRPSLKGGSPASCEMRPAPEFQE